MNEAKILRLILVWRNLEKKIQNNIGVIMKKR